MTDQRSKNDTQTRLIKAVGEVLAKKGFGKIGVNAVARQAGVDKVLIYRYFDGLNGLMQAYAKSADFWPSTAELLGEGAEFDALQAQPFAVVFIEVFRRYAKAIRSRPLTLEILAWETIERNALTIALEEVREAMGLELMSNMESLYAPPADWQAIANIFTGAIHYLAIRARKIDTFTGMSITKDSDWDRLIDSMECLVLNLKENKEG